MKTKRNSSEDHGRNTIIVIGYRNYLHVEMFGITIYKEISMTNQSLRRDLYKFKYHAQTAQKKSINTTIFQENIQKLTQFSVQILISI